MSDIHNDECREHDRNQRFPAKFRLRLKRDFDRVFQEGIVVADGVLVVHVTYNTLDYSRIGISIGRKYGKAHDRNRFKRWCREVFRRQREYLPVGLDIVIRAKAGSHPTFQSISQSLPALLARASMRLSRPR